VPRCLQPAPRVVRLAVRCFFQTRGIETRIADPDAALGVSRAVGTYRDYCSRIAFDPPVRAGPEVARIATLRLCENLMAADATPANALTVLCFEKFKRCATVRSTERPGHLPHAGCVFDISDAKVLRPLHPVGLAGGDVLIVSSIDLADCRLEERFLAIAQ
jgi:hypothetical protein